MISNDDPNGIESANNTSLDPVETLPDTQPSSMLDIGEVSSTDPRLKQLVYLLGRSAGLR